MYIVCIQKYVYVVFINLLFLQGLYHTVHFLFLPDEIILMVLSNLSQKDLTNCMLVCRRLLHIASDTSLCKDYQNTCTC